MALGMCNLHIPLH